MCLEACILEHRCAAESRQVADGWRRLSGVSNQVSLPTRVMPPAPCSQWWGLASDGPPASFLHHFSSFLLRCPLHGLNGSMAGPQLRNTLVETNHGRELDTQPNRRDVPVGSRAAPRNQVGSKRPLDELDPRHALAAGRGHASLSWTERKARENAAWDSRRPVDRELWIAATLQRQAAEAQLRAAQECVVQQSFSTAVPQLCSCRQSDNRLLGDDCVMVATFEVEHAAYFGQGSVVCEVTVPVGGARRTAWAASLSTRFKWAASPPALSSTPSTCRRGLCGMPAGCS